MNKQTVAILALTALGCILAAGLMFGSPTDTIEAAAVGLLGTVLGAIGGILAPSPTD